MNVIVKAAVASGLGSLFLGASIAISSATVAAGASRVHADKATTCNKGGTTTYCFIVDNKSSNGNALLGEAIGGIGLLGQSTSSVGVIGTSSTGVGVGGASSSGNGVYGVVLGYSGNTAGVYGGGPIGVYGTSSSSSSPGVYAYGASYGLYAESESSYHAYSAVYGYGPVIGGNFVNDTCCYAGLQGTTYDGTSGFPLAAFANNGSTGETTGEFYVNGSGDGYFSGNVTAVGGYKTVLRVRGGASLGASVPMAAQATMEDTGTARLVDGEGAVRFDSAFASTIDASRGYQVFLTPDGDTHGLYVAAKYERGFVVREIERGRSSLYFDYRIVARPQGASDARLPQMDIKGPMLAHPKRPQRPHDKPSIQLVNQ